MDAIEIDIDIEQEDLAVKGNALASGDAAQDKEVEDEIIRRLNSGDLWAWCVVIVTARFRQYRGRAVVGGCSYLGESDFRKGGYYDDMKQEAIDDLKRSMEEIIAKGGEATAARFAVEHAKVEG